MSFHLPPLRERVQDIGPLVRGMAARFAAKFRKELFQISLRALEVLEAHPWPGNIRQMENALQQAVLVSSGPELLWEHLPAVVRSHQPDPARPGVRPDSLAHHRENAEKLVIQRALADNGNSRSRAARALKISRVTLYKKMKQYGMMGTSAQPEEP
jgi:DNA-binding NtrC family response regulator